MRIHLNIGSNLGDRRALIGRAVAMLARRLGGCMLLSDYVESEPWGFESDNSFLNRGVLSVVSDRLHPEAVLDITQEVERAISAASHRNADGSYRDRLIDIDIIDVDGMEYSSPRLTLPHPRAALRQFVTGPMSELESRATGL